MLNAFKLANGLKISALLFALAAYASAIPNPPKSLVGPTTKAAEDGAQIQDLTKLIEVREGVFLSGMYLYGGLPQAIAEFITSNRTRRDGRYVLILLCPEENWLELWQAVANELWRAPRPKGSQPEFHLPWIDSHEFDVQYVKYDPATSSYLKAERPLTKRWFEDRIKELRFPATVPLYENEYRLRPRVDRATKPVRFNFFLKNLDKEKSSQSALASVLETETIETRADTPGSNLTATTRIRDMTFVVALNSTTLDWKMDNVTGSPMLEFPRERRKALLEDLRKKLPAKVFRYAAKIMIAADTQASGILSPATVKF